MKKTDIKEEIEKFKKMFKNNYDTVTKKGVIYHRFLIQKIDVPEEIKGKFLQILYDENKDPHVVLSIHGGLSDKEKERREETKKAKKEAKNNLLTAIKDNERLIREHSKKMNFDLCQDLKKEHDILDKEYNLNFARKKKD